MRGLHLLLLAASVLVIGVAYGPLLLGFGEDLWEKLHYQHYPFILLAAALLFTQRIAVAPSEEGRRPARWLTYVAYVVAWVLLGLAHYFPSPLIAAVSLVVLLGGWGLAIARAAGVDFPLGPWLLLWLVIPPPLRLDYRLMSYLQHTSSQLSSYALDLLGINHLMDGNALVLPDKQLFVDEACSGIISVISIVSCAAMYGVWRRRSASHAILTMLLAAGWAALLNVVRIVSIALAWVRLGLDWSEGLAHTVLGLVVFAGSLLLLVATDWLLKAVLAEIGPRWEQITSEPIGFGAGLVAVWDRLQLSDHTTPRPAVGLASLGAHGLAAASLGLAPMIAFAGLGASQFLLTEEAESSATTIDPVQFAEALQQDAMPQAVGDFRLISTEYQSRTVQSAFGQYSVVFEYADQHDLRYLVSCDFLFEGGWHELATCYSGIGWRIDQREVYTSTGGASGVKPFEFAQMDLTKPDGRLALVTYTACKIDGEPIRPPRFDLADRVLNALTRRRRASRRIPSFQSQVLVEQSTGITDATRESAKLLLETAERRFVEVVLQQPKLPR